jgi:cell wall-associated NlpC family hydrolase
MNYSVKEVEILRDRIAIESKKLLNVPFQHRGRTRFGLDCIGFLWLTYKRAGIDGPDNDGKSYEPNWFWFCNKDQRYLDKLLEYFYFVDEPLKGDVLTFHCFDKVLITHIGISLGNITFIHCPSSGSPNNRKVKLDDLDHRYWKKCFYRFLRYKDF